MKRFFYLIVFLLALVLTVAPNIVGRIAEKQVLQFFENAAITQQINTQQLSYDRGWFSSDLSFQGSVMNAPIVNELPVTTQLKIIHGPVLWPWLNASDDSAALLGLASMNGQFDLVNNIAIDANLAGKANGLLTFDTQAQANLKHPGTVIQHNRNSTQLDAFNIDIEFDGQHIESHLTANHIQFQNPAQEIYLTQPIIHFTATDNQREFSIETQENQFRRQYEGFNSQPLNLKVTQHKNADINTLDIVLNSVAFEGPDWSLDNPTIQIKLDQLSDDQVNFIRQQLPLYLSGQNSGFDLQILGKLVALLEQSQPSLNVILDAQHLNKPLNMSLDFLIEGELKGIQKLNPFSMLNLLKLNTQASVPIAFIEALNNPHIDIQIEDLVSKSLVRKKADNYVFYASLIEGKLKLNP